jgi:PAS domain-containing protein
MSSPAVIADRRFERRRPGPQQLPSEALEQMPALVVLERLPTPALAIDRVGAIVFANGAFCDMLGYTPDELLAMNFVELFYGPSAGGTFASFPSNAARLVELTHKHGHPVLASMSKSAMRRADDAIALATFADRSEELWLNGATSAC